MAYLSFRAILKNSWHENKFLGRTRQNEIEWQLIMLAALPYEEKLHYNWNKDYPAICLVSRDSFEIPPPSFWELFRRNRV